MNPVSINVYQRSDLNIDPRARFLSPGAMKATDSSGRFNIDETDHLLTGLLDPAGPSTRAVAHYIAEHHADWIKEALDDAGKSPIYSGARTARDYPSWFLRDYADEIRADLGDYLIEAFAVINEPFTIEYPEGKIEGKVLATEQSLRIRYTDAESESIETLIEWAKSDFDLEIETLSMVASGDTYQIEFQRNGKASKTYTWVGRSSLEFHLSMALLDHGADSLVLSYKEGERTLSARDFLIERGSAFAQGVDEWSRLVDFALAVSRAKRSVDRLFEAYESIRDRKLSAADQGKKRAQIFKSMTKAKADLHNVLHAIYEGTFFAVAGDGRVSKQTIERILNEAQDRLNDLLQAASPVDDTLANACKEAGLLVKQAQKMAGSIQEAA